MFSGLTDRQLGFLDNILHGIIITNPDGYIIYWNRACEKIFGYQRYEIVGKSARILYHGLDQENSFKKVVKQFRAGNPFVGQWKGFHKNSSTVWLDVRSKILRNDKGEDEAYLLSVYDIKSLKEKEQDLYEIRAKSEAILETSVDAFITIDKKGIVLSFNKAAEQMFGFSREEVIGRNVSFLMPEPYRGKHDEYIKNYLDTGEKKIIGTGREVYARKKDGTVFPVDLSVSEVKWDNKRIFSGIIKDITERRNLEKRILEISEGERKRIGRELHDGLGQMLTGIRMISENLARRLENGDTRGSDEVREISDMIKEADEQARSIAHGMINTDLEKKGLTPVLQNFCKRTEKVFNIRCNCSTTNCPPIKNYTLASNIFRIIQEAVNNGVKHGKAGNIEIRLMKISDNIVLVIDDDGTGFDDNFNMEESKGMGIQIMKYRAGLIGGTMEFIRTETDKTRVRCLMPEDAVPK